MMKINEKIEKIKTDKNEEIDLLTNLEKLSKILNEEQQLSFMATK